MNGDSTINEKLIKDYGNILFRISIVLLKNNMDAEDAVQSTFIKYIEKRPVIYSEEHLKRWLIRVCTNICKDMLRARKRQEFMPEGDIGGYYCLKESSGIFEALLKVSEKYRIVLELYYIEGYSVNEISGIIRRTPSAVKMRLQKGRKLLKEIYERDMK